MRDKDTQLLEEAYTKILAKEEFDEDLVRGSTNMPHGQGYPNVSSDDNMQLDDVLSIDDTVSYPAYVTAYDITREFGGHEEGGWYYTNYAVIDTYPKQANSEEEVVAIAKKMLKIIGDVDGKLRIFAENEVGSMVSDRPHYE